MEMQALPTEKERNEDEEASEPMLEAKTEEEEKNDHYAELQGPSEGIYSETCHGATSNKTTGKQTGGNARLYRAVCLFLALICLALLLAVVILSVKLHAGSTVCPGREETTAADRASCSFEQCQTRFPNIQHRQCQQCANGWLTFGQSCFFLSTFRLSWSESLQNCTSRGGTLAIINSQRLQSFLAKEGGLKYWIGLRQSGTTWTWVNKTDLQESHWAEAPLNGDCAILRGGSPPDKNWIKGSCQAYTYFICQLEL